MEIVEYAKANKIYKEPAFVWWVPSALKRRNVIISKVAIIVRNKIKFVIAIPATYNEAVELDRMNQNTY